MLWRCDGDEAAQEMRDGAVEMERCIKLARDVKDAVKRRVPDGGLLVHHIRALAAGAAQSDGEAGAQ